MLLTNLITPLAFLAATVSAIGSARVNNKCTSNVYVWPVGTNITGPYGLSGTVGYYAESFHVDPNTGGRALKISSHPNGLYTPGTPQTIFAYNLDVGANQVWFDLSNVFGNNPAFVGKKITVKSADPACTQEIVWPAGVPPAGSQVRVCSASSNVVLTLCA
ncbi:Putative protein of unknown function [Podospora comata]|uniref:Bys1 family protein n=1 Tax=Podospora comata TaxID=48703 RepID=A0ABY6S3S3_PODCO|nr:Putative protein of unknown function [Podospora comata]